MRLQLQQLRVVLQQVLELVMELEQLQAEQVQAEQVQVEQVQVEQLHESVLAMLLVMLQLSGLLVYDVEARVPIQVDW
tara:strand:+ start:39 stop:272 length:234 start_codon:yes stop_codon:yes gene_type:complete